MHVVIPVSHVDLHLAEVLCRRIVELGGIKGHTASIVSTRRVAESASGLVETLDPVCDSVEWVRLETELEKGWPRSANHIFQGSAEHVRGLGGSAPWYFLEADNTPLVAGWLDTLEVAYNRGARPFMGAINVTRMRNKATGDTVEKGTHMVGTGVYPHDLSAHSQIWRFLLTNPRPFDVAMQWEIVPHCTPTDLIQHNWGTVRYRYDRAGNIVCDSSDDVPPSPHYARQVSSSAVVLHGCKDGSLAKLLGGGGPRRGKTAYVPSQVTHDTLIEGASDPAPLPPAVPADPGDARERVKVLAASHGVATISKRTGLSRAEVKKILSEEGLT